MSRRWAARADANQPAIVAALRRAGCTVQHLHAVGSGCPDLLVGFVAPEGHRDLILVEVKDGAKRPSARRLTPDQEDWWAGWHGRAPVVVTNEAEALAAVGRGPVG